MSRSPYHHYDLCDIPLDRYKTIPVQSDEEIKEIPAYETMAGLYGFPGKVIVTYTLPLDLRAKTSR